MIIHSYDNKTKDLENAMQAWKTAMDNTAKEVKKLPKWTPKKGSDGLVDSKLRATINQRSTEELQAFFNVCTYCVPSEAMQLLIDQDKNPDKSVEKLISDAQALVDAAKQEADKTKHNGTDEYEQKTKIHQALNTGLEKLIEFNTQSKLNPENHVSKNEKYYMALGAFFGGIIGFIAGAVMGALAGLYITSALDPVATVGIAAAVYGLKELRPGMTRGAQQAKQLGKLWEYSGALKSSIKGAEKSYHDLQAAIKDVGGIKTEYGIHHKPSINL